MRGDVRGPSRQSLRRECPDCGDETTHTRYGQYPAVATTGAWGKYLNPVYVCHGCLRTHTLLCYETDTDADRPLWGEYPPNDPVHANAVTASRVVAERIDAAEKRREGASTPSLDVPDGEFLATVVQPDPLVVDDGDQAMRVHGDEGDWSLGEEVRVSHDGPVVTVEAVEDDEEAA